MKKNYKKILSLKTIVLETSYIITATKNIRIPQYNNNAYYSKQQYKNMIENSNFLPL